MVDTLNFETSHGFRHSHGKNRQEPGPIKLSSPEIQVKQNGCSGMSQLLERFGLGFLLFDRHSKPQDWNGAALASLGMNSRDICRSDDVSKAFQNLVRDIGFKHELDSLTWVVDAHLDGAPSIIREKSDLVMPGTSGVILMNRNKRTRPNVSRLQEMYGLTGAETQVLMAIACGQTLLEIANTRRLSRATIRSHLASVFGKTGTDRQSSLVALIDSFAVLP
jgi:DNA-binding CsgD family transcriptional regulator